MEYSAKALFWTVSMVAMALLSAWAVVRMQVVPGGSAKPGEHKAINGIRGLAAIFVYVNHSPGLLENMGYKVTHFSTWGRIYPNLGSFGVQVFFCITGFLFFDRILKTRNQIDWAAFFGARIRRLVPLYALSCVVVLAIAFLFRKQSSFSESDALTIAGITTFGFVNSTMKIAGFDLGAVNAVIWTLVHEWRFYCVLPLIGLISTRSYGPFVLVLAVGIAVVDFVNLSEGGSVYWVYFLVGICAALLAHKVKSVRPSVKAVLFVLSALCLVLTCLVKAPSYGYERFVISSLFFISLVLGDYRILHGRVLKLLGDISYSVYLLHLPIMFVLFKAVLHVVSVDELSEKLFWSLIVAMVPILVVACSLSFRYIEYPFILRKREVGMAPAPTPT